MPKLAHFFPVPRKIFVAAIIGNILEHYDSAIYGLLAPLLAPQFFPNHTPLTALILTYALIPLGILSRPIGALVIGRIGDQYGRSVALSFSIIGMAVVTGLMGFLPVYEQVGILAPILLALGRVLQNFFIASESIGAAIFILEHTKQKSKNWIGSLYGVSTMVGILCASAVVTALTLPSMPAFMWRFVFFLGFVTGLAGFYIRYQLPESPEFVEERRKQLQTSSQNTLSLLWQNKKKLLCLIAVSGFSYATYSAAFLFLNSFSPQVANVSLTDMMALNTSLLLFDMFLLPLFGYLADRISAARVMTLSALAIGVLSYPLFSLLPQANIFVVAFVRIVLIVFGVGFSTPFSAFTQALFPVHSRYSLIAFSYSIGSQLIGATLPAVCLWLYKMTGVVTMPAWYLMACSAFACGAMHMLSKEK